MLLILMGTALLLATANAGQDAPAASSSETNAEQFRRDYEAAFDDDDRERIDQLVLAHPWHFVPLFEKYAWQWIELTEEPDSAALLDWERARVLAESADDVLSAPALIEQFEALDGLDDAGRQDLRRARELFQEGVTEASRGDHASALVLMQESATLYDRLGEFAQANMALLEVAFFREKSGDVSGALEILKPLRERCERLQDPRILSMTLNNLGLNLQTAGDHAGAVAAFEQLAPIWERTGALQNLVNTLIDLGRSHRRLGQHEQAIACHQRVLGIRTAARGEELGGDAPVAQTLHDLGLNYQSLAQWDEAIDRFERALALREPLGDNADTAWSLHQLGQCYKEVGGGEKAIHCHERALAIREGLSNETDVALSLRCLGLAFYAFDRYEKSIECHRRALELDEKLDNVSDVAADYNNLGLVYVELGQYERAIEYHERSLALKKTLGDDSGIAKSLSNLGYCHLFAGRIEEAIHHQERSLELKRPIGDAANIARSLSCLGHCYTALGQVEPALEFHRQALEFREPLGNVHEITGSLIGLGNSYIRLGQHERALEHYRRALTIAEEAGLISMTVTSLHNIGSALSSAGRYEEAIDAIERSMVVNRQMGNRLYSDGWAWQTLGQAAHGLGRHEEAIESHERAFSIRQALGNPQDTARSLASIGQCHACVGRFPEAIEFYRRSCESLEQFSVRTFSTEGQARYRERWNVLGQLATHAAHRLADTPGTLGDAFWVVEAMRGRSLIGALAERSHAVFEGLDPELRERREQLQGRLESLRLQLGRSSDLSDKEGADLQQQLLSARDRLESFDRRLRQNNPRLMELTHPEAASVDVLQRLVLDENSALLEFVLGNEESFLWVVTESELHVLSLPASDVIRRMYDSYMQSLALADDEIADPDQSITAARELYDALLGKARILADTREWILVPDAFLGFLPFEALLTRDPTDKERGDLARWPYLIRERSVRYAPSASFLVFQRQNVRGLGDWDKQALLLGDPVYEGERIETEVLGDRSRGGLDVERFDRLRGTRDEVTTIAMELVGESEDRLFRKLRDLPRNGSVAGAQFDLHVGAEVTETRLKQDLTGYRIVHLATHGYFDPEFPWFSGLLLSDTPDAEPGDTGFLNLLELGTLQLDAQLVFLSACDTGKGQLLRSEGIQSVARSFLLAGAQSVVATQWQVQDDLASTLATGFYAHLFAGREPADALRGAKLDYIEQGGRGRGVSVTEGSSTLRHPHAHPSRWAPFVLYGGSR